MGFLSQATWDNYKSIIREFNKDDAGEQPITWLRFIGNVSRYGEDDNEQYDTIILQGLCHYNYFRSWPINTPSETGEVDKESLLVYFSKEYLNELGYLSSSNNFIFDGGKDYFKIDNVLYKAHGDSSTAQANDESLLTFLILERQERPTGFPINP